MQPRDTYDAQNFEVAVTFLESLWTLATNN